MFMWACMVVQKEAEAVSRRRKGLMELKIWFEKKLIKIFKNFIGYM